MESMVSSQSEGKYADGMEIWLVTGDEEVGIRYLDNISQCPCHIVPTPSKKGNCANETGGWVPLVWGYDKDLCSICVQLLIVCSIVQCFFN